jgi:hypothetical protein
VLTRLRAVEVRAGETIALGQVEYRLTHGLS